MLSLKQFALAEDRTDNCLRNAPSLTGSSRSIARRIFANFCCTDRSLLRATPAQRARAPGESTLLASADGVLDRRARRVITLVVFALQKHADNWNSDAKHSATAVERVRASLDLVVAKSPVPGSTRPEWLSSQSGSRRSCQQAGRNRPTTRHGWGRCDRASKLLICARSCLILSPRKDGAQAWPIMLRADEASGIRSDLSSASSYTGAQDDEAARSTTNDINMLLGRCGQSPSVSLASPTSSFPFAE